MGKYDPLGAHLARHGSAAAPMTFAEIEAVIGRSLPPAAGRHAAFWSNNPSNNVMTRVWLDAGFRTEQVDLAGRRLVFRRAAPAAGPPVEGGVLERLRAALGGTLRITEGVDLAAPGTDAWDAQR